MYIVSLLLLTVLTCRWEPSLYLINGSDVTATNADISRFMSGVPKHSVDTSSEYRKKELDGFLKTGKMPHKTLITKSDGLTNVVTDKMKKVPTEVLVKQFLDGGDHIKHHFEAAGRGRGPEETSAPSRAPNTEINKKVKSPPPTKFPKDSKKKKKGKDDSDLFTKAPKVAKKGPKKIKGGKEKYSSDFPSSSPTPTLPSSPTPSIPPAKGDVVVSPNNTVVEENKVNGGTGDSGTDKSSDGADLDSSAPSGSSQITRIVSPLAAFAGLLLIGGVWLSRRHKSDNRCDEDENLMKHTCEGFDVETGTVGGHTYRTDAYTEDEGTLDESIDIREENQRNRTSQNHAKEMIKVINELEEVSLNDDGASTTSVSSGSHSRTNSYDDHLIEAARAAMTADAFKPDKSKVYDSTVKPEWAARSYVNSDYGTTDASTESLDTHSTGNGHPSISHSGADDEQSSVKTTSYKKFIPSSIGHDVCADDRITLEADDTKVDAAQKEEETLAITAPSTVSAEKSNDDGNEKKPAWMNVQLRPVSSKVSIPNDDVFSSISSGANTEPEWMKKFKQMGLENKE